MQKTILSLTIGLSLFLGLSACQPTSNTSLESNDPKNAEQINTPTPIETTISKPITPTDSAIDAKTCLSLSNTIKKVDNTSKIDAIYAIQKQLKSCLPTASNDEVLSLLKDYQTMYKRFLSHETDMNTVESELAFFNILSALEQDKKIPKEDLEQISPRLRYLISLIQSDADVSVRHLGKGFYTFDHDLKAMADIFTPYLLPDQKAFIERMATDNQDIFWSDVAITTTFKELVKRAVFWEDYGQRYPNGYAIKDAKFLLDVYRNALFFGSNNTRWVDNNVQTFTQPQYQQLMMQLAKRPNSALAKDAQTYLEFLVLSDSERQQTYPAPSTDEMGYKLDERAMVHYQLKKRCRFLLFGMPMATIESA